MSRYTSPPKRHAWSFSGRSTLASELAYADGRFSLSRGWLAATIGRDAGDRADGFAGGVRRATDDRAQYPPGAVLYVDDYPIGTTPCATSFIYYGTRQIRLVKDGYETLVVNQPIPAPWYEYFPADFVTENLVPGHIRNVRVLTYDLRPMLMVPNDRSPVAPTRTARRGEGRTGVGRDHTAATRVCAADDRSADAGIAGADVFAAASDNLRPAEFATAKLCRAAQLRSATQFRIAGIYASRALTRVGCHVHDLAWTCFRAHGHAEP